MAAPRKAARKSTVTRTPQTSVHPHPQLDGKLTSMAQAMLLKLNAGPLADKVRVIWNARLQTTAGTACRTNSCIELNPLLKPLGATPVLRTLKHEVAHLLAHWRAGRRRIQTHGAEWHQACADLGIGDEKAFHDLPLPRRKLTRKFAYQCPHCHLIVLRVKPFRPVTACYPCCKKFNAGNYSKLYQFVQIKPFQKSGSARPPATG